MIGLEFALRRIARDDLPCMLCGASHEGEAADHQFQKMTAAQYAQSIVRLLEVAQGEIRKMKHMAEM